MRAKTLKTETRKLADLKGYERNSKRHPPEQIEALPVAPFL